MVYTRPQTPRSPLTQEKALEWIAALATHLGTHSPKLDWNPREKNGCYSLGTIHVGPRTWRGLDCLLHEFAHHVNRRPATFEEKQYGRGRRHHGENFYQALRRVVQAAEDVFGHEYDWRTEYKTLWRRRLGDRAAHAEAYARLQAAAGPSKRDVEK